MEIAFFLLSVTVSYSQDVEGGDPPALAPDHGKKSPTPTDIEQELQEELQKTLEQAQGITQFFVYHSELPESKLGAKTQVFTP